LSGGHTHDVPDSFSRLSALLRFTLIMWGLVSGLPGIVRSRSATPTLIGYAEREAFGVTRR
jgi:hypothetical protein